MSGALVSLAAAKQIRVGVYATDPDQHAKLASLATQAGHVLVDLQTADVIMTDSRQPPEAFDRVIVIGAANEEFAGTLPVDATVEQIDAAIRAVAAGLIVRASAPAPSGFNAVHEPDPGNLLTPREHEVLDCIAKGLTNKAIARQLDISLHTVKFHVESVFRKLGARTRTEAVAKAHCRARETIVL